MFTPLDTPRLVLRQLAESDVPALFAIFSDREAMLYWSRPRMTELAEAEALLREIEKHAASERFFQWGIARHGDGLVIGTCTLFRVDWEHRRCELGYILRRDLWGQGFATEALTVVLNHAFGALALHRLEADIDPRNTGSIRLVERLGFKKEGHLRERYFVAGDIQDSLIYGLLAPDWRPR